jgi:hypothetical protein
MRQLASPYVGPRPFELSEQRLFFGREREAEDVLSQIAFQRSVLLYAQSGAGKSSLINTSLIPGLRAAGFFVFPVIRIRGALDQAVDARTNIFLFNALSSTVAGATVRLPPISPSTSLEDFVATARDLWAGGHGPILIFDQFEELFTAHQDRWPQRAGLIQEIDRALRATPTLRVVFSMREDFIAAIDPLLWHLSEGIDVRYRLELLRREAATAAIVEPMRLSGASMQPDAAQKLVGDLLEINVEMQDGKVERVQGEYVEPVQLQIVCRRLWERLPPDVEVIARTHVEQFGDVGDALREFYDLAVESAAAATGYPAKLIHLGCTQFVTSSGTRGLVYRENDRIGMLPSAVADFLVEQHFLRSEARAAGRWYEIAHDRLIEPVLDRKLHDEDLKTLLHTRELLRAAVEQWKARREFIRDRHILTVLSEVKRELVLSNDELEFLGMNSIGAGFEIEAWMALLGEQAPSLVGDVLQRAAGHQLASIRRNASSALGYVDTVAADAALLQLATEDDDKDVQEQAAIAIARADRPALTRRVFALLLDRTSKPRALVALARMRDEYVDHPGSGDLIDQWRSAAVADRISLITTLARVRLEKRWPNLIYIALLGGIGAGLFCGVTRILPATFGFTITDPMTIRLDALFMGFFQGMAGGVAWGGSVGFYLALGWILFRGSNTGPIGRRYLVNVLLGILGGVMGGLGVFMEIYLVYDPFVLQQNGWLPLDVSVRDLGACVGTGHCLFHPSLGPAFGAGAAIALTALQASGRLDRLLAPHMAAGRIVDWQRTACRIAALSARFSLASLAMLSASALVYILEWHFRVAQVIGETFSIYAGNVGTIAGVLLGQIIMRVGIVIPPRSG